MASKYIRQTNHNRNGYKQAHSSGSSMEESTPELESDEDTDQEQLEPVQDANDFAIYTDDEDSPSFYTNHDEDIGLTVSEGDHDDDDNDGGGDDDDDDDTPQPHYTPSVINYMPSQSPEDEDEDIDTPGSIEEFESDSMEREEEDMIQDEFKQSSGSPNEGESLAHSDNDGESSDSEEDFYDFFENPIHNRNSQQDQYNEQYGNGDDDSYLWEYFFSSDSEGEGPGPLTAEGLHTTQEPDDAQAQNIGSGESTDEEDNLPVSSKRTSGNRAVEVLGANSQMRPPVLGSWNIENANGNVGIIDGLTTRTLSPPPQQQNDDEMDQAGNHSWISESEDEHPVQLDEFINTDELDFDEENDDDGYITTPLVYRSRFNKNVPMSAFRNRSSPYTSSQHAYDHSFRRRRRSFGAQPGNNVIISPVRSLRKRPKPRQRRPTQHKQQQPAVEDFNDNIFEFYELGNMTPLFEI